MPSTVIATMHYNAESRVLTIVYRGKRGTYRYFDVPPEEYAAFRAAPSKGKYLNEVFKIHGYRYERERNAVA
jgi:KTSC domain